MYSLGETFIWLLPNFWAMIYLSNLSHMTGAIVLKEDRHLMKIMLAACKKAITKRWYSAGPPAQDEWLKTVNGIYDMEQLTHS